MAKSKQGKKPAGEKKRTGGKTRNALLADPEIKKAHDLAVKWWPEMVTNFRADCCKRLQMLGFTVDAIASDLETTDEIINDLLAMQERRGIPPHSLGYIAEFCSTHCDDSVEQQLMDFADMKRLGGYWNQKTAKDEFISPSSGVTADNAVPHLGVDTPDDDREKRCIMIAADLVWFLATEVRTYCHEPFLSAVITEALSDDYGMRPDKVSEPRKSGEELFSVIDRCRPKDYYEFDLAFRSDWFAAVVRTLETDQSIRVEATRLAQAALLKGTPNLLDKARKHTPKLFFRLLGAAHRN